MYGQDGQVTDWSSYLVGVPIKMPPKCPIQAYITTMLKQLQSQLNLSPSEEKLVREDLKRCFENSEFDAILIGIDFPIGITVAVKKYLKYNGSVMNGSVI